MGDKRLKRQAREPVPAASPPSRPGGLASPVLPGLLLVALTAIAFAPTLAGPFFFDDFINVADNTRLRSLHGLWEIWTSPQQYDYWPLWQSLLWLQWQFWDGSPAGYHLVNIALHAIATVGCWRILLRLGVGAEIAWWTAAWFGVHPVNVETAGWITQQKNTLSAVWFAAAFYSYLRWDESSQPHWYAVGWSAFFLALLSKTSVAPLAVVLLGVGWWRRGSLNRRDLLAAGGFLVCAVVMGAIGLWFHATNAIATEVPREDGLLGRIAVAGWCVLFYIRTTLWPFGLCLVYPRWPLGNPSWIDAVPPLMLAGVFAFAIARRATWGKPLLAGLGYYLLLLGPALGILPISYMKFTLVADHWQYLAMPGLLVLVVGGIVGLCDRFPRWPGQKPVILAILVGVCFVATLQRSFLFADDQAVWREAIERQPDFWMPRGNLALILEQEKNPRGAWEVLRPGLLYPPTQSTDRAQLAQTLEALGIQLANKGDWQPAAEAMQASFDLVPPGESLRRNLAIAWTNAGAKWQQAGQNSAAVLAFQKAIATEAVAVEAANNLAWMYATSADPDLRNPAEAVRLAELAKLMRRPADATTLDTLATAYAASGDFARAVAVSDQALRLLADKPDHPLTKAIAARRQLYLRGEAYREGGL